MGLTVLFNNNYEKHRVDGLESKYLPFLKLKSYLDQNFPDKISIGKSFLGNEIFQLKIGTGKIKILIWSQMHGNESTGTRAMLDVFSFLKSETSWSDVILKELCIYYIPMLNPDGSSLYTRRNAAGIDLNRDFLQEASPEIKVLKAAVSEIQPDFMFNLHDQRSIFNVGDQSKPATMAFLAPSPDEIRSVTESRIKAMAVIDHMVKGLETVIPGHLSRFTDEFYPNSTGDNFTKLGFPCILFEAGHFPNDYSRNQVRKFNALAILLAFERISRSDVMEKGNYDNIPLNQKKYLDIILRNVQVESSESHAILDIGIYFEERVDLESQEVIYCSKIEEIGDLSAYYGHLDQDMKGEKYHGKSSVFPVIGELADFSVGNIHFENGNFKG